MGRVVVDRFIVWVSVKDGLNNVNVIADAMKMW